MRVDFIVDMAPRVSDECFINMSQTVNHSLLKGLLKEKSNKKISLECIKYSNHYFKHIVLIHLYLGIRVEYTIHTTEIYYQASGRFKILGAAKIHSYFDQFFFDFQNIFFL